MIGFGLETENLNYFHFVSFVLSGETVEERKAIRPIMIFVHGESFSWGSGNLWDGRVLAAFGNVIVITFNFRLGILGKTLIRYLGFVIE